MEILRAYLTLEVFERASEQPVLPFPILAHEADNLAGPLLQAIPANLLPALLPSFPLSPLGPNLAHEHRPLEDPGRDHQPPLDRPRLQRPPPNAARVW